MPPLDSGGAAPSSQPLLASNSAVTPKPSPAASSDWIPRPASSAPPPAQRLLQTRPPAPWRPSVHRLVPRRRKREHGRRQVLDCQQHRVVCHPQHRVAFGEASAPSAATPVQSPQYFTFKAAEGRKEASAATSATPAVTTTFGRIISGTAPARRATATAAARLSPCSPSSPPPPESTATHRPPSETPAPAARNPPPPGQAPC